MTPEVYVSDRVKHVLKALDADDSKAVEAYIASEVERGTAEGIRGRLFWRFGTAFGVVLGLALGVLGPSAYLLVQANEHVNITFPSLPSLPCPTCTVCDPPPVCPTPTAPVEWNALEDRWVTTSTPTTLKHSVAEGKECVSFSNGAVACIPVFAPPERVETPQ